MPKVVPCNAKNHILFLLLFCTLILPVSSWAGQGYQLTADAIADGVFSPPTWYYRDETEKVDLTKAKSLFTQNAYRRLTSDFNAGIGQPTYWFKVLLDVTKDFDSYKIPKVYLDIQDPLIDRLEVIHEVDGELYNRYVMGDSIPFSQRPFSTSTFVIPVRIKPGSVNEFWLKVENGGTMHLPVKVWTPEKFYDYESERFLSFGMFMGIASVMIIYNLIIGSRVKSTDYFFYVGFLISGSLHRFFLNGLAFQYLWPETPETNQVIRPILDCGIILFSLLFTQYFLSTKTQMPLLHKCINVWLGIAGLLAFAVFFIPYHYTLHLVVWIVMISLMAQYVIGLECWLNQIRLANLYLCAWFVFVSAGLTSSFAVFGLIPLNPITLHAIEYGTAFQIFILALALSDRISHIQEEKLEAEQKNVEHMAQYQDLYEKSFDGIFEINAEGFVKQMNPAFRKMFSIPIETAGKAFSFWEYWKDHTKLSEFKTALEAHYQVINFESQLFTNEERPIWTSITLQPSVKNGELHYDGVIRDISESKAKEQAVREKQDAEAATSAKSSFLANMSHEIRTPLTAIIGFAEDARDEKLSRTELNSSIDTIIRSSHHLLDIINEILDLSKIEAGKLDLEHINVNLLDLITDIYSVFDKRILAKGLTFKVEHELPLPKNITCDPTRLKQVILNLLSNALKFTKQGSVTLKLRYQQEQDLLTIEVIDTGIGMTQNQQEKVFEAFTQADVTTTRNFGGTGLGLSIVKQLTELMGGKVGISSKEGEGSTFSIELPANSEENPSLITETSQIKAVSSKRKDLEVPTLDAYILYADDNKVNQTLVRKLIKKTGAEINTVENGAEAMLSVFKRKPDLILMDIKMPIISGKTAGYLLREHGVDCPIIAFTANVMASEVDSYLKAGFNSYLEKPINIPKFYTQVAKELHAQTPLLNKKQNTSALSGKILVAEDNTVNQMLIHKFLKSQGADVTVVENGELAVDAAKNESFDLIFLDLEMPVMDGFAALEQLSAQDSPPIYALTADNDLSTKRDCEDKGFQGVLLKPIEKDVIRETLEKHLHPSDATP